MELNKQEIQELINEKIKTGEKQYGKSFKYAVLEILGLQKLLNPDSEETKPSRIIPLSKWNDYHDYPTIGAMRQYKHYMDKNGFDKVIEYGGTNGGTILINEDKFFEWLRNRKKYRNAS